MNNINICNFSGNITRDCETRQTAGGMTIARFGIAVNGSKKVDGKWEDDPSFFNLTMFGKRAEALAQYLTKGQKVFVQCKAKTSRYKDKNGNDRTAVDFIVEEIELAGKREKSADATESYDEPVPESIYDEDIPF